MSDVEPFSAFRGPENYPWGQLFRPRGRQKRYPATGGERPWTDLNCSSILWSTLATISTEIEDFSVHFAHKARKDRKYIGHSFSDNFGMDFGTIPATFFMNCQCAHVVAKPRCSVTLTINLHVFTLQKNAENHNFPQLL